jgi:hypothetical protein
MISPNFWSTSAILSNACNCIKTFICWPQVVLTKSSSARVGERIVRKLAFGLSGTGVFNNALWIGISLNNGEVPTKKTLALCWTSEQWAAVCGFNLQSQPVTASLFNCSKMYRMSQSAKLSSSPCLRFVMPGTFSKTNHINLWFFASQQIMFTTAVHTKLLGSLPNFLEPMDE